MVAIVCTLSPPIVPNCLCDGWVMGGVKDRYLKYASDGNQYVGCCANFAHQISIEFDFSPLHFYFSSFEMDDCIARKKELEKFISDCLYQLTDDANGGHVKYLS